ncbi:MAG: L,D-transpeptidase family protein [Rhizobiales bacterium]|nr:L,D-transpeptidase family protein [Hyphomicrobiales bacterium]MBO6700193.1 L,D-transpeptidase family protein [Hyphomicrobiales bacterium]MBO6737642.1 L,D-transpeptidase family protein [Hyphomicrobiales bacterium]MBO6913301.1 L,D-transpeptidase family protein [Hyphomicrobiales bacterium]MBO6956857.1 L,D-transpeptidase family protein [Hyphomicrobiales bacterium]
MNVLTKRTWLLAAVLTTALTSLGHATERHALDLECEVDPVCVEDAIARAIIINADFDALAEAAPFPIDPRLELAKPLTIVPQAVPDRPNTVITRTVPPAAAPAPVIDETAIAARDARMIETLTTQSIAAIISGGLENDGETTSQERQAVEAFYAERDHAPLFLTAGGLNARGETLLNLFQTADIYGLNPVDFENTAFIDDEAEASDAMAAARADIGMTLWALRYARHAMTGRVNPASIGRDITLERNFVDPATVMPALLASDDLAEALLAYHPQHDQFHALREELANLRERSETEILEPIAEGGTIRLGDVDPRVPQLRDRLGLPDPMMTASIDEAEVQLVSTQTDEDPDPTQPDPNLFDEALDAAVKTFQAEHNLTADGIVGPATFAALNEKAGDLVPDIIANMERWRWMPRELGDFHVIANVPEYRLWVMREGESIFTTRTVVGQNRHRTAIFSDEMEYMAVNPYWNVPSSIARNEILPRLLQDPGYANRGNYEILYNGQTIDPFAVNWQAAAEQGMPRIRQRPGARNALGEIKFMFPNQHAIYFHDTPSRGLFGRDQRAFSHGCVRVLDPWAFAEALLTNEPDWDLARARSLQGSRERNLILDNHIPVHLTYFTARVNEDGRLIMARDIYGHHGRVLAALGFTGS